MLDTKSIFELSGCCQGSRGAECAAGASTVAYHQGTHRGGPSAVSVLNLRDRSAVSSREAERARQLVHIGAGARVCDHVHLPRSVRLRCWLGRHIRSGVCFADCASRPFAGPCGSICSCWSERRVCFVHEHLLTPISASCRHQVTHFLSPRAMASVCVMSREPYTAAHTEQHTEQLLNLLSTNAEDTVPAPDSVHSFFSSDTADGGMLAQAHAPRSPTALSCSAALCRRLLSGLLHASNSRSSRIIFVIFLSCRCCSCWSWRCCCRIGCPCSIAPSRSWPGFSERQFIRSQPCVW